MNNYYSCNHSNHYFDEPQTTVRSNKTVSAKDVVDTFNKSLKNYRYTVKRPTIKKIGHVEKQS